MGFALWMDEDVAWAAGTHEYKPMGSAVIAVTDTFRPRDFRARRRTPSRLDRRYVGLFASLEDVNRFLRQLRKTRRNPPVRITPPHI